MTAPSGNWKVGFTGTRQFRLLVTFLAMTIATATVIVVEVVPWLRSRDRPPGKDSYSSSAPVLAPAGSQALIPFHGVLGKLEDGTPIEEESDQYRQLMGYLLRTERDLFPREGKLVKYSALMGAPDRFRGESISISGLYVHSDPIRLGRTLHGREWVYRAYLVDPSGEEGYVVDLVERPELSVRTLASVDSVFLKLVSYEGKKGLVKAPLLLGRDLRRVEEKVTSGLLNQGAIIVALAAVSVGVCIALVLNVAGKCRTLLKG